MDASPLRIGLAGLGTVGGGIVDLLKENADVLTARAGRPLVISAASARHAAKCPKGARFVADARALATAMDVDVVVEVIGGAEGIAQELVMGALQAGKPVVTANKALLARHGLMLANLAETGKTQVRFEAAVAGGIPIVSALREGLGGNRVTRLRGIVNGSTNYILSTMMHGRRPYEEVEAEAKRLGYLEADPSLDVDGHDAAQKLALLSAIAFSLAPNEEAVTRQGIRGVTLAHLSEAEEMDYTIKLIAEAAATPKGIVQTVAPMLIARTSPVALVNGALNILIADTAPGGRFVFTGAGAGAGPTASAVVADLVALARGAVVPMFGVPAASLLPAGQAIVGENRELHSTELPYPVFSLE